MFGLGNIDITAETITNVALVIGIGIVILGLLGFFTYMVMMKKVYVYRVCVWKKIGNYATKVGESKAKLVAIGKAGDYLMYIKGFKKWVAVPQLQIARNEYWFYVREDGEWINFVMEDLDETSKKMGIKFIHQDMRLARLSIDDLLANRLLQKSFLEKWGMVIGFTIFFLIIAISLVIFMYQFGKTSMEFGEVARILKETIQIAQTGSSGGASPLIPVD